MSEDEKVVSANFRATYDLTEAELKMIEDDPAGFRALFEKMFSDEIEKIVDQILEARGIV